MAFFCALVIPAMFDAEVLLIQYIDLFSLLESTVVKISNVEFFSKELLEI
jgi:hypothetical protein